MRLRRQWVNALLVVLAVVAGVYLAIDVSAPPVNEGARPRNLLPTFRRSAVSSVAIERPDGAVRLLRRVGDGGESAYELEGEAADPSSVDKLLGVLEFATWERRLAGDLDRQAFGLTSPRQRMVIRSDQGAYELVLGASAPTPIGAAYLEVVGQGVFVIGRDLVNELTRPTSVYRERSLLPIRLGEVTEITLRQGDSSFSMPRGPWGGFGVRVAGRLVRAEPASMERVLAALAELRAETFVSDQQAEVWLGPEATRVHVALAHAGAYAEAGAHAGAGDAGAHAGAGARQVTLELGGSCPGESASVVAVRRTPLPVKSACVPGGALAPLLPAAAPQPDLRAFSMRVDEVERIALTGPALSLELVRAGTAWHERAPDDRAVAHDLGQAVVVDVLGIVAEGLAVAAAGGRAGELGATGRGRAELARTEGEGAEGEGAAGSEKLEWGEPVGPWVYATRVQDGAVLKLARAAVTALEPSAVTLRARRVVDVPVGSIERIAVEGASVRQVLHRADGGAYVLERPSGYVVDPALAHDIAETLSALAAQRWVADEEQPSHELGSPRARYELVSAGTPVRIEVGGAAQGGAFARRVGSGGVFVLSEATRRTLETWAIDRTACMLDPSAARSMVLQGGGRRLDLRGELQGEPRRDRRNRSDAAASEDPFELAVRVLSEARAEGVVHIGPPVNGEGFAAPELRVTVELKDGRPYRMTIGHTAVFRDVRVWYARCDGVDATFAIAASKLAPLLDAFSSRAR